MEIVMTSKNLAILQQIYGVKTGLQSLCPLEEDWLIASLHSVTNITVTDSKGEKDEIIYLLILLVSPVDLSPWDLAILKCSGWSLYGVNYKSNTGSPTQIGIFVNLSG